MSKILCKLGFHKYNWTKETKDWFFTGIVKGHIGNKCARCGKLGKL
jgi:uncharacterized OB-fold protein